MSSREEHGMTDVHLDRLANHRDAVRGFVLRLVRDEAVADDVTQETFLRAQRSPSPHRGAASEKSWLCAIALNLVRDRYRAAARGREVPTDAGVLEAVASDSDTEQVILQAEMSACIGEHLLQLPHPQYEVVALHDLGRLAHREIAALLGLSEGHSRVVLHRGRAALRAILERNCILSLDGDPVPCERRPPSPEKAPLRFVDGEGA
jgi:RNA polymerase sigma-70 factor (ECF subfamily)